MYLVVIRYKHGVHIIQLIDELHASVISEQEAGGAQSVRGERGIRDDGHTVQVVVAWISCGRIQYMMIERPVLFKIPLVYTGCDDGLVCDFDGSDRFSTLVKRFLYPDVIIRAVQLGPDSENISAEIYEGMLYPLLL